MTQPEAMEPQAEETVEAPGAEQTEATGQTLGGPDIGPNGPEFAAAPIMKPDGTVRGQLLSDLSDTKTAPSDPDVASYVYDSVGLNGQEVRIRGYNTQMADIEPGDLIGWYGGHDPNGVYVGNMAVYAGNREIIETSQGVTRRRKLSPYENTFGIPVMPYSTATNPGAQQENPPTDVPIQ